MSHYPPLMGYSYIQPAMHGYGHSMYGYSLGNTPASVDEPGDLNDFTPELQAKSQRFDQAIDGLQVGLGKLQVKWIGHANEATIRAAIASLEKLRKSYPKQGPLTANTDDQIWTLYQALLDIYNYDFMDGEDLELVDGKIAEYSSNTYTSLEGVVDALLEMYNAYFAAYYEEPSETKPAGAVTQKQTPSGRVKPAVVKAPATQTRVATTPPKAGKSNNRKKWLWGGLLVLGALGVGGIVYAVNQKKRQRYDRW